VGEVRILGAEPIKKEKRMHHHGFIKLTLQSGGGPLLVLAHEIVAIHPVYPDFEGTKVHLKGSDGFGFLVKETPDDILHALNELVTEVKTELKHKLHINDPGPVPNYHGGSGHLGM
jgi:hypothetical protein